MSLGTSSPQNRTWARPGTVARETRDAGTGWRSMRAHAHGGCREQARNNDATYTPSTQLRTPCADQAAAPTYLTAAHFRTNALTDAATKEKPCFRGHRRASADAAQPGNCHPAARTQARNHASDRDGSRSKASEPSHHMSVSFFDDGGVELPGPGCALLAGGACRGDLAVGARSGRGAGAEKAPGAGGADVDPIAFEEAAIIQHCPQIEHALARAVIEVEPVALFRRDDVLPQQVSSPVLDRGLVA